MSGDRKKDSKVVVNINDAKEDEVQFAFIPESEYNSAMSDGKIKDSYLESYDNSIINVSQTSSVDAKWENEKNLTYTVNIAGTTGELLCWYSYDGQCRKQYRCYF